MWQELIVGSCIVIAIIFTLRKLLAKSGNCAGCNGCNKPGACSTPSVKSIK